MDHPELRHDEMWFAFTELIVRGLGGAGPQARELAVEMTRLWERSETFDLYEDALPTWASSLRGSARSSGSSPTAAAKSPTSSCTALPSSTSTARIASRAQGRIKPHESIFRAALELLGVEAEEKR